MKQLRIIDEPTPVFLANEKAYSEGWPVICNEGGSRSGKSYSIIKLLIQIALEQPKIRISIVSHSLPHIKRGAFRDFKDIMEKWHIWKDEEFSFTNFEYHYKNGSYIELFGLEDESKARGPGRDILFINEANLIKKPLYDQLAMRTTSTQFLDWNPADFLSWVYELADNPKNKRIHSTYKNNLSNLSQNQINTIESYKDLPDDFWWKVYGLGERGASKELIYTSWKQVNELPGKGDVVYGLDFGYNHPCVLVKVEYYEGSVYIEEKIYQSGLTITDLAAKMKSLCLGNAIIYADHAEPKSIEELRRYKFNVKEADKDVWNGILKVKSLSVYYTYNSKNIHNERLSYKWKTNSNNDIIEEPVKSNDDAMDAIRYAIHTHLSAPAKRAFFAV